MLTILSFVLCIVGPISWVLSEDAINNGINVNTVLITSQIMTFTGCMAMIWIVHVSRIEWKEYSWSFIPSIVSTNCTLLAVITNMGIEDPRCRLLLEDIPLEDISNDVLISVQKYSYYVLAFSFIAFFMICTIKVLNSEEHLHPAEICAYALCMTIMFMYISLLAGACVVLMCICDDARSSGGCGVPSYNKNVYNEMV